MENLKLPFEVLINDKAVFSLFSTPSIYRPLHPLNI